ncbi:MAG: Chemotaxis protein methyltransferase [Hydrocarboniphaga sp.]|uniref:CheR family methyltransferase n=1 Tax=Hydrocarboniphaga sp. TaxID=2033016 RepID=UPI0026334FED|nr:CheR family methyltransferase [Hydrocarboniphaga sp.]MDB5972786.1 Chemotaxis protein methyltransferase [Hydrocarboniphaga sp.]
MSTQLAARDAAGAVELAGFDLNAREFTLTDGDFRRVCAMIRARAGIALNDSKRDLVYSRLVRRLRACGADSFRAYLDPLEADANADEWQEFTNALTTNLTSFFREEHHFERLAELLAQRQPGEHLLLWCAASSTGEEPYSIAITAAEVFGTMKPPVSILATDIDTQVLATAAEGIYTQDRIEKLSDARRRKFFKRGAGGNQGLCRVNDELRSLVSFRQLNLLGERYPMKGPFRAVFCRNVMIYFDKPTQYTVLSRIAPLLSPEGLLFAGHSESFFHAGDLFESCGRTIYKRARSR